MSAQLQVAIGQASERGRKPVNQDFHGAMLPRPAMSLSKGVAVALADGISSSEVSQVASETAVKGLLEDYYATAEAWTVKNSVQRVLWAINSWLYSATRNGPYRYNIDKGYVCTITALVFKSCTAHVFHVGDTRAYRIAGNKLEQLTEDHRHWQSSENSYLNRAMGMRERLEIDYNAYPVDVGDTFLLATDGVYEFIDSDFICATIRLAQDDLDLAASTIVEEALRRGSDDNLTVQIARVDGLPQRDVRELQEKTLVLPFPPELRPRMEFDGYQIARDLHSNSRSHVYLAVDGVTQQQVVLKVPSVELRGDDAYLESFLMEEWVARRLDNSHLLKAYPQERPRNYLYTVTEYVEGKTLAQWMLDNPITDLETVRDIVTQLGAGLQAMHRQEILHQDLRPNNVMIDTHGTVKIIDFGSVRVAGIAEMAGAGQQHILGTMLYTAPEYFVGEEGTEKSDLFSLGVITYQLLSGRLPYGTTVARATTRAAQRRLSYRSVLDTERALPAWVDTTLRKALHINPAKRYHALSEFIYDLRHPNPAYLRAERAPIIERNPLLFWKTTSVVLSILLLALLASHPLITA